MPEKSGRLILRPHHTLCLQFFAGRGYSGEFVQNMFHIRQMLVEKPKRIILLHSGADDICAACPNNRSGRCRTQQKVDRYDEKCRRACDFSRSNCSRGKKQTAVSGSGFSAARGFAIGSVPTVCGIPFVNNKMLKTQSKMFKTHGSVQNVNNFLINYRPKDGF